MDEKTFWERLEFRICGEMNGLDDCRRLGLWCDGLRPQLYEPSGESPSISGDAWIGLGPRDQQCWTFTLLLPAPVTDREAVVWQDLLPAEDETGWLGFDADAGQLMLAPGDAVPDEA